MRASEHKKSKARETLSAPKGIAKILDTDIEVIGEKSWPDKMKDFTPEQRRVIEMSKSKHEVWKNIRD